MRIKIAIYTVSIMFILSLSSCLKHGLDDDLPVFTDADITAFNFEFRWLINEGGSEKLQVKNLTTATTITDGMISCSIVVPPASGTFTEAVRAQVTLAALNGYATISPAASITPKGNTPVLGKVGDYAKQDMAYQVTAADGKTTKEWKLTIVEFVNE